MRTLRLRTRSLHACSIGKKTRQTEPAQQNNQILTLEGHDINNTVFLWWLSSLPSAEMKVDTIKLLQSWVVKKRKRTKTDKQTTTTTITHFGKVFFAIPGKERLRMKWPCYISAVVKSISMTNLNDFKVCYSRRDRAGRMEH